MNNEADRKCAVKTLTCKMLNCILKFLIFYGSMTGWRWCDADDMHYTYSRYAIICHHYNNKDEEVCMAYNFVLCKL